MGFKKINDFLDKGSPEYLRHNFQVIWDEIS